MEFDAFGFFISMINFLVMFFLFYHVVITPMEGAVALRQRKVTSRLDEIRQTMVTAQKLEDEVKSQYAKLDSDRQEMREATEREIARVQKQLAEQSQKDAEHLVAKTRRELEKNRQDTLAALNRQLTDRAMTKVEGLLTQALDSQAQNSSAELMLGKVVQRGA